MASISATPSARAACCTNPKISSARARVRSSDSFIGAADFHIAEARRARAMAGSHHLLGLALSAIGRAPECPVLRACDGGAGVPEFRADAAIAGVLQHSRALAVANLPGDLTAELKVVALVIDGPALVGLHIDGVVHAAENFVDGLGAGLEADVGHADERNPRPAVSAHGAVRAALAHRGGSLSRGHIADEQAGADDVGPMRGHAFIVERESAEAGAVLGARIANHVDQVRSVAQLAELIEGEKTHARIIGLTAEDAVELDGVADRLVNLQGQLRAIQNQMEGALGALIGGVQRD